VGVGRCGELHWKKKVSDTHGERSCGGDTRGEGGGGWREEEEEEVRVRVEIDVGLYIRRWGDLSHPDLDPMA
jgi:hypothetical protein